MFLDLVKLPPEGEVVDRTLSGASVPTEGEEFRVVSDVRVAGRVQPVDSDEHGVFRLTGSISCRIEVPCVRCLEPFAMDVAEELELLYLPQARNAAPRASESHVDSTGPRTGRNEDGASSRHGGRASRENVSPGATGEPADDRGLDRDELAVAFYEDERIDLGQLIREQIVLALPMKPLCGEDCRGLCPECGINRNTASCDCSIEDTDPRWATLKSLLGR